MSPHFSTRNLTSWCHQCSRLGWGERQRRADRTRRGAVPRLEWLEDRLAPSLGTLVLLEGPAGGTDSDIVATTGTWSATANASWLHTTASGTGNGLATFTFDANSGATRSGTLTIAGQTLTVTQAGSSYLAANPASSLASNGLSPPYGMAVDGAGNVYFADTNNNAIEEWNATTQTVTTLVSSGLNEPGDVAVDGAGNVYIADTGHSAIEEWNATTQTVTTLVSSGLSMPWGVAVDGAGYVYIADTSNNAIEEWNATTQTVNTLVSSGLNDPTAVAVDAAGNVFFTDLNLNNNLREWNAATGQISTLVASGLPEPHGLAVNGEDNVYIASNNAIEEWNATTQTVTTLISGLNNPNGVAVDATGNIYIADTGNNAVKEQPRAFVPGGMVSEKASAGSDQLLPVLPTTESLAGLFAPSSDQPWLTIVSIFSGVIHFSFSQNTSGAARTAHITVLGQQITVTQAASALGTYALLEGPASGTDSDIVVDGGSWSATSNASWLHTTFSGAGNGLATFTFDANSGATRSGTLTIAGQTLTVTQAGSNYVAANPVTPLASEGLFPPDGLVAVDGVGNVFITDQYTGILQEWNATTQTVITLVSSGLNEPEGVAVDGAGNVYFADTGNNAIDEWNATTQTVTTLVSSGLRTPFGVAVDGAGNVYFSDSGNNAIDEWNATTQTVTTLVSGLNDPTGVAVDVAGNVYFSDTGNNAIDEWNATTQTVITLVSSGLDMPVGVAVDAAGNVYIADTDNNAIKEWNATTQTVTTLVSASAGLNSQPKGVAVDGAGNVYIGLVNVFFPSYDLALSAIEEQPRAFVPGGPVSEGAAAGSDQLPPVLPNTESLTGLFAPSSDQPWLTIGSISGGVIQFSFTQNTSGAARTANITVLGQQITVNQAAPPVVTSSTVNLAANASSLTISGNGFDTNTANDSVSFDNGVIGTVTSASLTSLTVSVSGLTTLTGGTVLEASVTVDGVSSGSAVQVATIAPVITSSTANLAADASTLTISGYGFDTIAEDDSVSFDNGVIGTVASASLTSLTVSVTGLSNLMGGTALHASVAVDDVSSGSAVQVATIAPVVTSSTANLGANATSLSLSGYGFDTATANDSVTFENGVIGTVTSASLTSMTVSISGLSSLTGGTVLEASVTVDDVSSGGLVQVATIAPVVTSSTANLGANATSLTISGYGFDTATANDSVTFENGVIGTVTSASLTSMTINVSSLTTLTGGTVLQASVTVDGVSSGGFVPVALLAPVVTPSMADLPATATALIVNGYGFDPNTANDSVTFLNSGVTGTVIDASLTSMTVNVRGLSSLIGGTLLEAGVTVNGVNSGGFVAVAAITPVVIPGTANLPATATTLIISGHGFDTNTSNDSITFLNNGVTGTVTSTSLTSMTINVRGLTTLTGGTVLEASVTVDGVGSGFVPVATIAPVVNPSTANLPVTATTLFISGYGFDLNTANDSIAFLNDGVTGTVTSASLTGLTISVSGLSNLTGGTVLQASVTVDGVSSGGFVPVALLAPVVTPSMADLPATATALIVNGYGFDPNTANDSVTFLNSGVTGTVIDASLTSMTVNIRGLSSLIGGTLLEAGVTVNGVSSGGFVAVATITPVVIPGTANLPATATTLIISGHGFDTNTSNDSITFLNNGVTGTVTSASLTSMTINVSGLTTLTGGTVLEASVTVDGVGSGFVPVATIAPVVNPSTANLPVTATTLFISGYGFDPNTANDSIAFLNDGVTGTVTSASLTGLTVSVSGLSNLTGGTVLQASVTVDGVSSGGFVPVALLAPVVTPSMADLPATATALIVNGYGFDPNTANDSVTFLNSGVTGTVIDASLTSMTVNIRGLSSLIGGTLLEAGVTVNGVSSGGFVAVATITPVVIPGTANLPATATTLIISGHGFDTNTSNDSITFLNNGVTGTVTSASLTSMTINVSGLTTLTGGTVLEASVTVDGVGSGFVPVATIAPVVNPSTANLPVTATTLFISGYGFDPNTANDSIAFLNDGVTGTVTSASLTGLTVSVSGLSNLTGGTVLQASVTVDGVSSGGFVPVALLAPVVTPSMVDLPANATTLIISGYGFDANTANDRVTFDNGVTGTVTSASLTSLTVSVNGLTTVTGGTVLKVRVTVNDASSGDLVQVATIAPVVTSSTVNLPANAITLTISGYGFDTNTAQDSATFDDGVTGRVTSTSLTSMTVNVSGLSSLTGGTVLKASVTVDGVSSSGLVPVALLAPVVTSSTAILPATATTLTISGYGFDPNTANDNVTFDHGVTDPVINASLTSLTISVSGLSSLTGETALHASVTVNGVSSGFVPVAILAPVVTPSTANLPVDATSLTINGYGFDPNPAQDSVRFNQGVIGTVTGASLTSLIVRVSGLITLTAGTVLKASVTVNGASSGVPVPVATLVGLPGSPMSFFPAISLPQVPLHVPVFSGSAGPTGALPTPPPSPLPGGAVTSLAGEPNPEDLFGETRFLGPPPNLPPVNPSESNPSSKGTPSGIGRKKQDLFEGPSWREGLPLRLGSSLLESDDSVVLVEAILRGTTPGGAPSPVKPAATEGEPVSNSGGAVREETQSVQAARPTAVADSPRWNWKVVPVVIVTFLVGGGTFLGWWHRHRARPNSLARKSATSGLPNHPKKDI